MASANDESVLLERVFLRVGTADTDEQFQNVLAKFLPPVLLKLASPHEGVRKKVMELLLHVNKRVKSRSQVQLPVEALLQQYQDPATTSFVINFTIIYLKLGFPRLTVDEQVALVPLLLNSLEGKPQTHQDSLLLLIIPLLGKVTVPTDPAKRSLLFGLNEKPQISKHLLVLLVDMLLLPYGAISPTSNPANKTDAPALSIPPGMSEYSFKRVTTDYALKPEELEQIKLGIVKFLAYEIFPNEEVLLHLIVAASDTRFSVANLADNELKKIVGQLDWSLPSISMGLYMLFLGSQTQNVKPNMKKLPASTRIRLKLLTYLCRVTGGGFVLPPAIQVIFDSLYGTNTNTRLKTLALNFTINMVQFADTDNLAKISNVLKSGMIKLTNEGELIHQGQAFVVLGAISRRFPMVVFHDTSLIEMFYKKLEEGDTDLKLQIREGALNVIQAFKYENNPSECNHNDRLNILYLMLKFYMQSQEPMVRFVVVRSLALFFPPDHVPSKFLLLLASGDTKDDVSTDALKSLYGTSRRQDVDLSAKPTESTNSLAPNEDQKVTMPQFDQIIEYIHAESNKKDNPYRTSIGNNAIPFPPNIFVEMLIYSRLCLIQSLEVPLTRDVLKHPTDESPVIRAYLKQLYNNHEMKASLVKYIVLLRQLVMTNQAVEPLSCLVEVVGCLPELQTDLELDLTKVRDLLLSTKEETREHAAILYGILINEAVDKEKEFDEVLEYLLKLTANKSVEAQNGGILSLGCCLERRLMTKKSLRRDMLKNVIETIASFLQSQQVLLSSAACISLGLIAKSTSLPLENGLDDKSDTESPDIKKMAKLTKQVLITQVLDVMNNVKLSTKCRERAVRALGLLCVGEANFPFTRQVIEGFINTVKDTKDVEVHFTIGESLVMCIQGTTSSEARNAWVISSDDYSKSVQTVGNNDEDLSWLLDELLKYSLSTHPNSKQAASIWLLALLKSCMERKVIQDKLRTIQAAFMDLLAVNSDIVQDVASKGLCLIYDYTKSEELLTALVDQLTSGRRQAVQVSNDTKLFDEGQLGKSPTGGNLSTYKELCSLASELNKPDLIYQFMHLANHNSMWNSKKGAAFGFGSIAKKCGEHLTQHLPNIIPKLYRYQYDPSPNLQASMQNIWHVLVQEPTKMLDLYHHEILKELLANINSNQYRVRQSCCAALQDFLKGAGNRSIHDSVDYMEELWSKLFRVMDDHHEQTRIVAGKTTRTLSKLCIRGCDLSQGKSATKMMDSILPVLLNNGIINAVQEVRLISLQTISELVGAAGKQLKPFLPKLIPALLQATGELESAKLSYLSTMYGAQSQVQDVVDSARASMAKSHFTTETVSKCIQYADASIMEELTPRVVELMKGNIGLGTRVACAHFVTLLTLQLGQDLQPYTGKFLAALVNGLTDRNSSIRKHYALAIGHIVKTAKESSLVKLFDKIQHWYFEREDDTIRSACALTIQSIGNQNQEVLKNFSDVVLPLVFFAMHADKTPETQNTLEIWNEIWAEQSPGSETGIRQNLENICKILQTALESPSWNMKAQAANSVSTIANKLGTTMDAKHRNNLVSILVNGLTGRTWSGKDKLLNALASICSNCKESIKTDPDLDINIIIDAIIRESKKEEIVYKTKALEALGNVLLAMEIDKFEEVHSIVEATLTGSPGSVEDEDDVSKEEINSNRENLLKLKETVYDLLGKSWPKDAKVTQEKFNDMFVEHCVTTLPLTTRTIQVAIVGALCNYVDKLVLLEQEVLTSEEDSNLQKIIDNLLIALTYSLGIAKHTRLRKEALNVFNSLGKRQKINKIKSISPKCRLHSTPSWRKFQKTINPRSSPE
ncbi:proteasome adapter and scaffold protein ECM29-like [Atheta coriaria]|uniref:proteasome adapter and scaffold protein ECM29-like n=1 Tax=Dalotia coriaria TaxID=877792 RepID=UPI0031F3619A